ncbi:hypothetical protein [Thalassospira xiamenensis]|uniref:Uncharacterized protein n=1 Tax=Thalassospira xiamenensis TaxID=220697 RepID=A0A367X3A0_9PROT|nr:hypothetical protein [Thalassospira xiamenensis]MCK2166503.1 hypothetical protein [Thalassospira xiamenensis]RCK48154.1 hypothetical protein TH44_16685 [Thalassospira xiamenensis]
MAEENERQSSGAPARPPASGASGSGVGAKGLGDLIRRVLFGRVLYVRGAAILGSVMLTGLVVVLYVGFVVTLFAGFTADIQRELLSRELELSSPGDLERLVFQGYHEAQLKGDIHAMRTEIRMLDAASLNAARHGLALRQDAIAAWRAAFDLYAGLGAVMAAQPDRFDPEFRTDYLAALNQAFAFLAQSDFSAEAGRPSPDTARTDEGKEVIANLDTALSHMKLAPGVSEAFATDIQSRIDAIRNAVMSFGEKAARAQVAWANITAEQAQADRLRASLMAELSDLREEHAALWADEDATDDGGRRSLVALFQQPLGGVLSLLLQMPGIVLTLLVTVAAGGLGSVVSFTRRYRRVGEGGEADIEMAEGDMAPETGFAAAGRLMVMTGEGIAAAIAIFLFTEAGMLMVTQGGPDGSGNIEISAFLVTFMAFVSGFMAEDAFNKIQDAGRKLFRVGGDDGPGPAGM